MPQRRTIFYLDDDPTQLELFREMFGSYYHVQTSTDYTEGLRMLAWCSADIIISDYLMPGVSGTEFLRAAAKVCPASFRILLTGQLRVGDVLADVASGAVQLFITKPWEEREIREALGRAEATLDAPSRYRGDERRGAPRLEAHLEARVLMIAEREGESAGEEVLALSGYARDVSESGLALVVSEQEADEVFSLGEGSLLRMTLPLPGGPVGLTAKPVRREQVSEGVCVIGAQITDMSGRDRVIFMNYLRELAARAARR
jgi:CheY-like chemotaxis protein